MSLINLYKTYQPLLLLVPILFGPNLLKRLVALTRPAAPSPPKPRRQPLPKPLVALLLLHSTYHIASLLFPPYDIFSTPHLPLLAPNDRLRSALLPSSPIPTQPSKGDELHPLQELLLQRLQSLDNRYYYLRFGHKALVECVWCTAKADYALAALPGILGVYVVEGLLLGVLGWGWVAGGEAARRKAGLRGAAAWGLIGMAVGELGIRYFWEIRAVHGDCLHLSSTVHTWRSVLFLFLPIIYTFLPLTHPKVPLSSVLPALANAQSTIRLSSLARQAVSRDPRLRRGWVLAGEQESRAGKAGREDPGVNQEALDFGIREEDVRGNAGRWVKEGWDGLVRIEERVPPIAL